MNMMDVDIRHDCISAEKSMTNGWEKRASGRYATDCPTPDRTRLETGGRTGQQHPGARRAGRLNERAYTLGETSHLGYLLMVSM